MAGASEKSSQNEPLTCFHCKKAVVDAVSCLRCGSQYHPSCAKVSGFLPNGSIIKCCKPRARVASASDNTSPSTVNDVDRIVSNAVNLLSASIEGLSKKMDEYSLQINSNTARIVSVESEVQILSNKLSAVEGTISDINTIVQSKDTITHDSLLNNCMQELEDRIARKKNIMVFGLPENSGPPSAINLLVDDNLLLEIKNLVFGSVATVLMDKVVTRRVGKLSSDRQGQHPRPVKISCVSTSHARDLFHAFMSAKKDVSRMDNLRNIWVTYDKTNAEIRELRSVKAELSSRQERGESNLTIAYRRGRPAIIVKPRPQTQIRGGDT